MPDDKGNEYEVIESITWGIWTSIKKYILEQEIHDIEMDKLSVREYEAPFKGRK